MTELATDPLTLGHVAITLIAIVSGLIVLAAMVRGQNPKGLTAIFLLQLHKHRISSSVGADPGRSGPVTA